MAVHQKDVIREWRASERGVAKFNRRLGIAITDGVATMWCAYAFAIIALVSLPQAIQESFAGGFHALPIITWIAQTFLQLVLLSIILFGQSILSEKADARAEATFRNTKDAETRLEEILKGLAARGEENARMEQQNNEILKRLEARK
jgi:ABC-type multidrug transport system fused ATPase/permease subunit